MRPHLGKRLAKYERNRKSPHRGRLLAKLRFTVDYRTSMTTLPLPKIAEEETVARG